MKKFWAMLCVCALCVMLPVMALALTETEWNQQCKLKIGSSVTIYSVNQSDSTTGELATGTDIDMWVSGTLSAGTYIKQNSYDSQLKMWEISYYKNGGVAAAFIRDGGKIVSALATVRIFDGKSYETVQVPEALIGDPSALCRYLAGEYPGYTFSMMEDGVTVFKEKSSGNGSNGTGSGSGSGSGSSWKSLQQLAEEAAAKLNVNLEDLPKALIYAPRTGEASLRRTAKGNGKVIEKYKDGTIVYIVEEGEKFSQVLVGDKTGYVINSALEILDPDELPYGEGVLSSRGKTTGAAMINLRCDPKGRKIDTWRVGTEVIIWSVSEDEQWYEVEYQDVRLYVQAQYLTVTEVYDYDAEEEEESTETDLDAEAWADYGEDEDWDDEDWDDDVYYGDDYDYYANYEVED